MFPDHNRPQNDDTLLCVCPALKPVLSFPVSEEDHLGFLAESSEYDDPGKIQESKRLADYVERFPMFSLSIKALEKFI